MSDSSDLSCPENFEFVDYNDEEELDSRGRPVVRLSLEDVRSFRALEESVSRDRFNISRSPVHTGRARSVDRSAERAENYVNREEVLHEDLFASSSVCRRFGLAAQVAELKKHVLENINDVLTIIL
ncbi:hypothetical protein M8J77_021578 [Diaphorina citri]|nr:hypothetical protein M8J77_021578 [Diaphorina citri]